MYVILKKRGYTTLCNSVLESDFPDKFQRLKCLSIFYNKEAGNNGQFLPKTPFFLPSQQTTVTLKIWLHQFVNHELLNYIARLSFAGNTAYLCGKYSTTCGWEDVFQKPSVDRNAKGLV